MFFASELRIAITLSRTRYALGSPKGLFPRHIIGAPVLIPKSERRKRTECGKSTHTTDALTHTGKHESRISLFSSLLFIFIPFLPKECGNNTPKT